MSETKDYWSCAQQQYRAGELDKALSCLAQILQQTPDDVPALFLSGMAQFQSRNWTEALVPMIRAQELAPDRVDILSNLGSMYCEMGLFDKAALSFRHATELAQNEPMNLAIVKFNEALLNFYRTPLSQWSDIAQQYEHYFSNAPAYAYEVCVRGALPLWAEGKGEALIKRLALANSHLSRLAPEAVKAMRNAYVYHRILLRLIQEEPLSPATNSAKLIAVIGDSHLLSYCGVMLDIDGPHHCVASHLIVGAKAYHLGQEGKTNKFKEAFINACQTLRSGSQCLLCFGEIDCRADEGILYHSRKYKQNMPDVAEACATRYVHLAASLLKERNITPIFTTVPEPYFKELRLTIEVETVLKDTVLCYNAALRSESARQGGCLLLDLYALTEGKNGSCHLDARHLKPAALCGLTVSR
ncbi:MAG: hypothetical protein RBT70_03135 [Alphaproteobacteria bacterium]|nr:hypothetical protein [Alphaproteobacteria bacterium]